jgi:hypothetical protein
MFLLGFLSPANRGALMTCALVLYVCLGTPAGYVAARYLTVNLYFKNGVFFMFLVIFCCVYCFLFRLLTKSFYYCYITIFLLS